MRRLACALRPLAFVTSVNPETKPFQWNQPYHARMPSSHSVTFALAEEESMLPPILLLRRHISTLLWGWFCATELPSFSLSEINCYNKIQQQNVRLAVSAKHRYGHGLGSGEGNQDHNSNHHKGEKKISQTKLSITGNRGRQLDSLGSILHKVQ